MVMEYKVSLVKLGGGLVFTIPQAVVRGFDLARGDELVLLVRDDGLTIPLKEKT